MGARMTTLVRARARAPAQGVHRFRIDVVIDAEMRRGPPEQSGRHEVQFDHRDIVRPAPEAPRATAVAAADEDV